MGQGVVFSITQGGGAALKSGDTVKVQIIARRNAEKARRPAPSMQRLRSHNTMGNQFLSANGRSHPVSLLEAMKALSKSSEWRIRCLSGRMTVPR
jgi:hypothetical protein